MYLMFVGFFPYLFPSICLWLSIRTSVVCVHVYVWRIHSLPQHALVFARAPTHFHLHPDVCECFQ